MEIHLSHGTYSALVETQGGELVSYRDGAGTEYIWGGDSAYWSGRNPILFPFVGNLKNGKTRFNAKTYEMPRHGFARRKKFTPVEQGEDFVALELREDPETLKLYPYPFRLEVCHRLIDEGFSTQFRVENPGDAPLPFCIGAHTAFRCPLRPGERFEDYRLVFDHSERAATLPLSPQGLLLPGQGEPILTGSDTLLLDYSHFDRLDTLIFEALRSTGVSLLHRETGKGVHMDFPDFPMIAFWTMPHKQAPYICLEPWHGCAAYENESGEFTDKPHCITLAPGEIKTLTYTVRVI